MFLYLFYIKCVNLLFNGEKLIFVLFCISGGVSTAGVIGGIIAAAVILIIIIAIIYIVRKRSSKKPQGK